MACFAAYTAFGILFGLPSLRLLFILSVAAGAIMFSLLFYLQLSFSLFAGMAGSRMDDQVRWFIEDQEVVVFVEDVEGDRFRLEVERLDRW